MGGLTALNCSPVAVTNLTSTFKRTKIILVVVLEAGGGGLGDIYKPTVVSTVINVARPSVCNMALRFGGPFVLTYLTSNVNNTVVKFNKMGRCMCKAGKVFK